MSRALVGAGIVGAGALVALDLSTKAHGRAEGTPIGNDEQSFSPTPRWVHHEHGGPRLLGAAVALVPAAAGIGGALGVRRLGGPAGLAATGAALMATGGMLNGVELGARGTNTNPIQLFGSYFNVADVALVGGAALLGIAAFPSLVRVLAR